jgi:hypothetical protein
MLSPLSAVPASNITTATNAKGGVTKSYLVPTKTLPLVALNPRLKAQEATLRKQIDAAYIRNDPKKTSAATTVAGLAPAPADVVSVPMVAAEPVIEAITAFNATAALAPGSTGAVIVEPLLASGELEAGITVLFMPIHTLQPMSTGRAWAGWSR